MIKDHSNLSFRFVNRLTGWAIFVITTFTYILTAEPTAGLWDCSEFITTSVGLQVGHPPGAPLFMIISRLFAIFAPSVETQALMINYMSGLCSSFTVLFLFWSIAHLARKLVLKEGEQMTLNQLIAIVGASVVGSLAYAFSDTFWFSAVEGEVYAMSSLFTAVVFWAILKWENVAHEPYSNRWLVLIAFLIGLSIGVHLLNLLAIPAIVFVYYFKKYKTTKIGMIKTALVSLIILGVINFKLIPGLLEIAGLFELLFVNEMGLPFNTGVLVYVLLIIGILVWGIRYTIRKEMPIWNTILTCFMVILIGYSSYSMTVIRSLSNTPIDENTPDNVFSLLSYINREQYGDSPLVYGHYYNAPVVENGEGSPMYYQNKETNVYEKIGNKYEPIYDKRFCGLFPRMHSSRNNHPQLYSMWAGKNNGPTYTIDGKSVTVPSFGNNLKYFFKYQLGHMYWRYFMWNFSGRQNDVQNRGDMLNGNWITGIQFLDEMRLGNLSELPDHLKTEESRNKYYMLPFLLGIFGMIYQYRKKAQGKKDFFAVILLFLMTGIAIIIFLNQGPMEPRERDYAYAGSFYAFSIWIGLGVLAIWEFMNKHIKKINPTSSAIAVGGICLLVVPINMLAENWDDHSRAGRYATIAHAKNTLNSCEPNAILFTYGDNDTFTLWYAQEVEGVRRDIRVVNLSLLNGGWYVDQIARKAYESDGVPLSFTYNQYRDGKRDYVYIFERFSKANMKDALEFVASDLPHTKKIPGETTGRLIDHMPTRNLFIPIDSAQVIAQGVVKPEDADKIVKEININLKGSGMSKSDLMMFDIISRNNWERPIYFFGGGGSDSYKGFEKYFQLEGVAYRLVPIETKATGLGYGRIDSDILYDHVMNKFEWGNIKDTTVYIDHFHNWHVGVMGYRTNFLRLAEQLKSEGKNEKAISVLDKSLEELPLSQIKIEESLVYYIQLYYALGETEKANQLLIEVADENYQMLKYIHSLSPEFSNRLQHKEKGSFEIIQMLFSMAHQAGEKDLAMKIGNKVNAIFTQDPMHNAPRSAPKTSDSAEQVKMQQN